MKIIFMILIGLATNAILDVYFDYGFVKRLLFFLVISLNILFWWLSFK